MKDMRLPKRRLGVTLLEVLMGLVALGVLLAIAFPSVVTLMQNARLRAQAESVTRGLELARAEARRRNQPVEFVLVFGPLANPAQATWSAIGESWVVRTASGRAPDVIDARSAVRSGGLADSTDVRVEASHHRRTDQSLGSSIVFEPSGALAGAAPIRLDVTPMSGECAGLRCMRIVVGTDGQLRLCEPNGDLREPLRRCPAPVG